MQPRIFAWSRVLNNNQKVKYFSKLLELMTLMMIEGHYPLLAHSITYFYWLKALELDYHSEWVLLFCSGIRGNGTCSGVEAAECHWESMRSLLFFRNSSAHASDGLFKLHRQTLLSAESNHWLLGRHSEVNAPSSTKLHLSGFHSRLSLRRQPVWNREFNSECMCHWDGWSYR